MVSLEAMESAVILMEKKLNVEQIESDILPVIIHHLDNDHDEE